MCNSRSGAAEVSKFPELIQVLIDFFHPKENKSIELSLPILISFIFTVPGKKKDSCSFLKNVLKRLNAKKDKVNAWKKIADSIYHTTGSSLVTSIVTFLNGVFLKISKENDHALLYDFVSTIKSYHIVQRLFENPVRIPGIDVLKQNVNIESRDLENFFPTKKVNFFNLKKLVHYLKEHQKDKKLIPGIIISLSEIKLKEPLEFPKLVTFLYNFLLTYRWLQPSIPNERIRSAISYSLKAKVVFTPILTEDIIEDNVFADNLFDAYQYTTTGELIKVFF